MTSKVKLFFVFLAITAIISVFSFFDVFTGVRSAKLHDAVTPLLPVTEDADQDGLSDTDESYWNTDFQNPDTDGDGFIDGEEVASGYDPRERSDHELGDSLQDTIYGAPKDTDIDFNITNNLLENMVSGIYAEDLKPGVDDAKFEEGVNTISFSVLDNFYRIQDPPKITNNIVDDSKENQVTYLNSIAEIVKNDLLDFPQKLNTSLGITDQLSFFEAKSNQFKTSYDKIAVLNIPGSWLETHTAILDIIYRFHLNYRYVAGYDSDMLKSTLALGELSNLNLELPALLKSIKTKIATNNLTVDNSLYQILDLIYKE